MLFRGKNGIEPALIREVELPCQEDISTVEEKKIG
jgi:hypothetical protein